MYFSAHYSDREPAYFRCSTWRAAASIGARQGTMITLYWLADEDPDPAAIEALTAEQVPAQ